LELPARKSGIAGEAPRAENKSGGGSRKKKSKKKKNALGGKKKGRGGPALRGKSNSTEKKKSRY